MPKGNYNFAQYHRNLKSVIL